MSNSVINSAIPGRNSVIFDKIIGRYATGQLAEIERWIDEGALSGSTQPICDVIRFVEMRFGKGTFSNEEIVDYIGQVRGCFTNRIESDTGDMCYVDLDKLAEKLSEQTGKKVSPDAEYLMNEVKTDAGAAMMN